MIRAATPADIPHLIAMNQALHAESPRYSTLSFSEQKLRMQWGQMLTGTLSTDPMGGIFIAERGGETIGMIAGFVTEHFFSYDKVASDYTLYIKPEHRGGFTAVCLIRVFEQWAIGQGATDIIPGTSTMINAEGTRDLYLRLGYEHYGYSMFKRIK